jgi:hemerythrin-like domain-containing protein
MKIVDALIGEHAVIRVLLSAVAPREGHRTREEIHAMLSVVKAVLCGHAAIEDELLFDQLSEYPVAHNSVLDAMRQEHREINNTLNALSEVDPDAFASRFATFRGTVEEHFAIEERVLFRIAANAVSQAQLEDAAIQYKKRRGLEA